MGKKVSITARPKVAPDADKWVEDRKPPPQTAADGMMKRLTIDIPVDLHTQLKVSCASKGKRMADVIRQLIEKEVKS